MIARTVDTAGARSDIADAKVGRTWFRLCRDRLEGDGMAAPHLVELYVVACLDIMGASVHTVDDDMECQRRLLLYRDRQMRLQPAAFANRADAIEAACPIIGI